MAPTQKTTGRTLFDFLSELSPVLQRVLIACVVFVPVLAFLIGGKVSKDGIETGGLLKNVRGKTHTIGKIELVNGLKSISAKVKKNGKTQIIEIEVERITYGAIDITSAKGSYSGTDANQEILAYVLANKGQDYYFKRLDFPESGQWKLDKWITLGSRKEIDTQLPFQVGFFLSDLDADSQCSKRLLNFDDEGKSNLIKKEDLPENCTTNLGAFTINRLS